MSGSIRQLPSGRYLARITVRGEAYSRVHDTPEECEGWIAAIKAASERRTKAPLTLAVWMERWIEERDRRGEVSHAAKLHSRRKAHIEPWPAAHYPIKELKRQHVSAWVTHLLDERDLSRQTVKHVLTDIRGALRAAADEGKVPRNVAQDVRVPRRPNKVPRRGVYLTAAQVAELLAKVDELSGVDDTRKHERAPWPSYYRVAIYCGLRTRELRELTWSNVKPGRLEIRRGLKTPNARRDVPLLPEPERALKAWRALSNPSHLRVWPGRSGGALGATYDAGWRKTVRPALGFDGVRFRDFRVTCGSHLISGTWGVRLTLEECKQWLGHSSITVTERHYAHLLPGGILDKVARLRREEG